MKTALRLAKVIVGVYLAVGVGWILILDGFAFPEAPWWFQTAKGILYLVVTAPLLFWFARRIGLRLSDEAACYYSAFESDPTPIIVADHSLRIVDMNPAARLFYSAATNFGKGTMLTDFWPREARADAAARLRSDLLSDGRFETRHVLENGQTKEVTLTIRWLPAKGGALLLMCVQDLTGWHASENQVRTLANIHAGLVSANHAIMKIQDVSTMLEQCCRIAVDNGGFQLAWIGLVDRETNSLQISASAGESDGFSEKIATRFNELCVGECELCKTLRDGHPMTCTFNADWPCCNSCKTAAAQMGFRAVAAFPLRLQEKKCHGVFMLYAVDPQTFSHDQTSLLKELSINIAFSLECREEARLRAEAQRALRKSEERFWQFLHKVPEAVVMLKEGRVSFMSDVAVALIGAPSVESVIGKDIIEMVHPLSREAAKKRLHAVCHEKQIVKMAETEWLRFDGAPVSCEVSCLPFNFNDKDGAIVFVRDVSTRNRVQEQLRQEQRAEALGRLAGGVAHDFNNLLQVINGASELAYDAMNINHPSRELIEKIRGAGKKAALLVERLLIIGNRHRLYKEPLDITALINESLYRFEQSLNAKIQIDCMLSKNALHVNGDRSTLKQLFENLCSNACSAMQDRGVLTIATEEVVLDETSSILNARAKPGRYVVLQVSDTGPCIPKEMLDHIFDPFFTTKGDQRGEGLGLAIVSSIVMQHNGFIRVESASGDGTTFKIYLPAAQKHAETHEEAIVASGTRGRGETILVAEDDAMVRALTSRILRLAGYTVLEARDGQEAVEVFQAHEKKVDGVILDVIMPRMDGFEVHERLMALAPKTPIIFVSAFSEGALNAKCALIDGVNLVQKPYDRQVLLGVLRNVLDKSVLTTSPSGKREEKRTVSV